MAFEVGSGSSALNNIVGNENNSNNNTRMTLAALVVDDDENERNAFIEILQTYGYETFAVNDGRQAIDLFNSGKQFDVIFLETKPSLNGLQTTRDLRAIGVRSMIVGMEARSNNFGGEFGESARDTLFRRLREFRESGLDIYYQKPVARLSVGLLYNEIAKKKRAAENAQA